MLVLLDISVLVMLARFARAYDFQTCILGQ